MITRAHVMPYMGQHVVVRTGDGAIHHGILHSVTDDGIYLRGMRGTMASAEGNERAIELLGKLADPGSDAQEAWFPFLFFPWWWIGGFWPGWWW